MKAAGLALMALLFAAMGPTMIYSSYTNAPSFTCPTDGVTLKCALYQASDRWKPLETPILRKECAPGTTCSLISLSKPGNSIRWLPGDIWMSAYRFEGWALYEDGQNPYPVEPQPPAPTPDPEPPKVCQKVCKNMSIHGICTSYRLVCQPASS